MAQATSSAAMYAMAATLRSTGVITSVCGNVRSMLTPDTQGLLSRPCAIAASLTFRSVVPSGTWSSACASCWETCSLPCTWISVAENTGENASTAKETPSTASAARAMSA